MSKTTETTRANLIKSKQFTSTPQIDWLTLQINYNFKVESPEGLSRQLVLDNNYSFKIMPYNTRVFKRVIEITDISIGEVVATITDQPTSPAIRQDLVLIKFHNKLLYHEDLKGYILNFCEVNNFEILSISRIDIATDFIQFANNLKPQKFIERFLKGSYIKKGQGKYKVAGKYQEAQNDPEYISNGSYGKKINHEYLRFGTNNNGLKYYIYNKSKELKDVKYKPYIVDRWRKYGYEETETAPDVWRLEFSITSNNIRFIEDTTGAPLTKGKGIIYEKNLIDLQTGEATEVIEYNIKSLQCLDVEVLNKIWASLVNKYMVFYKPNLSKKTRGKQVQLFKQLPDYVSYTCQIDDKDSTNTDKNFIRNLRRTYEDLRNKDFVLNDQLQKLIRYQVEKRGLKKWALHKEILNFDINSIFSYQGSNEEIYQAKKETEAQKTARFNKEQQKPPE